MTSGINEANRFDRTRVPPPTPDTRVVGDGYAPNSDTLLHFTVQGRDGKRITAWRQAAGWSAGPEPRSIDEIAAQPAPPAAGELPTGQFKIGDCVEAVPPFALVCGSGRYDYATVVSVSPFVLASEHGDMLWKTVSQEKVLRIGDATWSALYSGLGRYAKDAGLVSGDKWLTASRPDPGCFAGGDAGKEIESLRSLLVSTTLVGVSRDRNFGEFLSREGRQPKGDAELFAWTISRAEAAETELTRLRRENADLNRLLADFRADVTRRVPLGEPVAREWTNKPPTVVGWYWFRKYPTWPIKMTQVEANHDGTGVLFEGWPPHMTVKETEGKCRWAGPIPIPADEGERNEL